MIDCDQPWDSAETYYVRRRRGLLFGRLVRSPGGMLGLLLVVLVILVAILAPVLSPHDPAKQNIVYRLKPPFWMEDGSLEHPLGTDSVGRDILSRVIYGSRISIFVGLVATAASALLGVSLGLFAGFLGGAVDSVISRVGDVQQAIPFLVLAIAVAAMLGPGLFNLILVLVITTWVTFFRVVRGEVLSVREEQYVLGAKSIGASNLRIILRYILPNVAASIIVIATLLVANMIIFEASLSFLGLGVPSSIPTWGRIVADGREYIADEWWIAFFPGLAILITVMGINLFGDWLREDLDPKQRNR
ncbi:MAG: ABC transporter permease [Anaerolineae bacterium]|jgi:peptide/nickel transport system permease protein